MVEAGPMRIDQLHNEIKMEKLQQVVDLEGYDQNKRQQQFQFSSGATQERGTSGFGARGGGQKRSNYQGSYPVNYRV